MKSHLAGYAPATALLGFMFEFGIGVPLCYKRAEKLYKQASETSIGLAQTRLSFLKTHGRGEIAINLKQARVYKLQIDECSDATRWLKLGAAHGLASAQFCLAICYYNGTSLPLDYERAFHLCERAAIQGLAVAMNVLGNLYTEGHGVTQDPLTGMIWYIQAAELREPAAIYNIGTLFERGLGVETSLPKALEWFRRAAYYGSVNAENVLGIFCEQGGESGFASLEGIRS
jgi:TPR repeat protein